MTASHPTDRQTIAVLRIAARALGRPAAYWHEGRFWFPLSDTHALAISPDSAGRFRLDACHGTAVRGTVWVLPSDLSRVAALAQGLRAEIAALIEG